MLGDFAGSVKRVGGGDYGSEGHDGEADNGKVNRVRGEKEDDVALSNAHVGKRGGDGIDGLPELLEGEVATGGGIDESNLAMVSARGDESSDVQGLVLR